MQEDYLITSQECQSFRKDFMREIHDIKDAVNDVKIQIAKLPDELLERTDKRYAGKTTEKIVYSSVGVILTLVLTAVVYLVLK